jgi:tRNA pseudouridine38-40 synthase
LSKHQKQYYLIKLQYLGFRYHGWQVQPNVKTVQKMVERTLSFVFDHTNFKILGASRTDMMVSANGSAFELFIDEDLDETDLKKRLNKSLPNDIRILDIEEVTAGFNVIQDSKEKEYTYLFSFGEKIHPFCAPFMVGVLEDLNIELMQEGALLFKGIHNFQRYAYKPSENTKFTREIISCEIVENTELTASFFPDKSYVFKIKGTGFLRYQIRLMVGILMQLGKGEVAIDFIKDTLDNPSSETLKELAPASGLTLNSLKFNSF